ncbi:MAG: iron ABC transporter permease [Proteobacteria bacterium]|nr:iron ABC transporter permease [Pseudomonadota bacterium]
MTFKKKYVVFIISAALILWALPFIGSENLSFQAVWKSSGQYALDHRILWSLRIPRLILVLTVGASLAVLGASYQVVFNNVLAEPYILGVSSGVTLGLVVAETFFDLRSGTPQNIAVGLLFAGLVVMLFLLSYQWRSGRGLEKIVLFGMGLNFVFSSLLFLVLSYRSQSLGAGSIRWLFGHIPWLNTSQSLIFLLINLTFLSGLWAMGRLIDGLTLGDSVAYTFGFSPAKIRGLLFLLTSLQLTLITSITGAIGFIGLVVPHCVRLLFHPGSTRLLFIISALGGALFLGLSDSLSRTLLPPLEFPIGVITTLLGGPLFLALLWKK